MGTARSSAHRVPLSTGRIVARAMHIADESGVAALSMRSLAHSLGFEVMALYNHVASKRELLSLMVDAVAAEVAVPPHDRRALDAARAVAVSTHATLLRHPWAAELWQQHPPGPTRTDLMEVLLRLLDGSGLSPGLAHDGFHAVVNHVVGYTLQEVGFLLADRASPTSGEDFLAGMSPETHPYMVAHVRQHLAGETGSSFELVLDLILDGLVRIDGGVLGADAPQHRKA